MVKLPHRTLADWTPAEGDVDAWLARWAEDAWVPEHSWGGTGTVVNGQPLVRWAMIETAEGGPGYGRGVSPGYGGDI